VLPLALSVVVLFHRRDLVAALAALIGFGPLVFSQSAVSALPAFICIAMVGVGLAFAGAGLSACPIDLSAEGGVQSPAYQGQAQP
jgi:hypothetical protein